jgi:cytochrome bd-type quinol oxidase subunit 2
MKGVDELNRVLSIICGFIAGFSFGAAILKDDITARGYLIVVGFVMILYTWLAYKYTDEKEQEKAREVSRKRGW